MGSAIHDTRPQFPDYICRHSPPALPVRTPLLEQIICKLMEHDYAPINRIADALNRIRLIADTVNAHYQEPEFWRREDDLSPLYMIGPVTHTLLCVPRVDPKADDINSTELLCEMVRLAMLILLAALKRMYSFSLDEIELTTLTAKFSSVLWTYCQNSSLQRNDSLHRLQLWALLTVATLQPFMHRVLFVSEIRRCMSYLDIKHASDAFQLSRDIAWLEIIGGTDMENKPFMMAIDNAKPP